MTQISEKQAKNFWSKVSFRLRNGCWLWRAAKSRNGYGAFWLNGKMVRTHRLSYELLVEDIPEGLVIDHQCHVRHCVNPAHLRVCSNRENLQNLKGKSSGKYTSKYPGVYWNKQKKKWQAQIHINGKNKHLGYFLTEDEAYAAYRAPISALHADSASSTGTEGHQSQPFASGAQVGEHHSEVLPLSLGLGFGLADFSE